MDLARLKALLEEQSDGNRQLLDALRNAGADLTKPAHILHYLYFRDREIAEAVAQDLREKGYDPVTVRLSRAQPLLRRIFGPREYSCIAETRAAPTPENVAETTKLMCTIAVLGRGQYDGWEASLEK